MDTPTRLFLIAVTATVGLFAGGLVSSVVYALPQPAKYPFLAERVPLPHHVPKYAGGVAFRFAMVQDVIHERFAKHGAAHYRERDRLTREKLQALPIDDPKRFPFYDDLGAGLDRLGRSDEAVAAIREKLALQQKQGLAGRDLYTSYANLGTFLIHGSAKQAAAGDASARERFREGVALVRKSVEVNPEAHFGRERWQAAIAEFLLAAMDDPALLTRSDCLGNSLDLPVLQMMDRESNWTVTGFGRPFDPAFSQGKVDDALPEFFLPGTPLDQASLWTELSPIREHITRVGAEWGERFGAVPSNTIPAPFDEPMLGIIGMWRQGGGANPHFALAVGETMLRVGQRYIAWSAFERASRLADRYSGDEAMHKFLRDHCRKRQSEIELSLATRTRDSQPASPRVREDDLRAKFVAELAYGEGFQRAYQDYEAAKISAGASINDNHFFDDFARRAEVIASPSGSEEWYARVPRKKINIYIRDHIRAYAVFGGGLAAFATALLLRRFRSRSRGAHGARLLTDVVLHEPTEIEYIQE